MVAAMFSLLPTDCLLRPKHLHPRVSTPDDYLREQWQSIIAKKQAFPHLGWQLPWAFVGTAPIKVSDGQWQIVCGCGQNTPLYDPEWELACCFTCGAIIRQTPPLEWREIERVLLNRPNMTNRHMLVSQTLAELCAENREHGDPD